MASRVSQAEQYRRARFLFERRRAQAFAVKAARTKRAVDVLMRQVMILDAMGDQLNGRGNVVREREKYLGNATAGSLATLKGSRKALENRARQYAGQRNRTRNLATKYMQTRKTGMVIRKRSSQLEAEESKRKALATVLASRVPQLAMQARGAQTLAR